MADPRFRSTEEPRDDYPRLRDRPRYGGDYGADRNEYSSAREYEAAGEFGSDRGGRSRGGLGSRGDDYYRGGDYGRGDYGRGDYSGGRDYRGDYGSGRENSYRGSYASDGHRFTDYGGNRDRDYDRDEGRRGGGRNERGFFDRAGDEVRSWFGDEEAERRREADARQSDRDYHSWRSRQIAHFDRDYDEYRRENAQRFENEFGAWRTERQGQRGSLERVSQHMEVVGSDGQHVGTVDKVRGDRIILTKGDKDAGGHHHSIPSRWIDSVDDKVNIRKTAEEAKAHWRDEERSGAMFGSSGLDEPEGPTSVYYRSFTGLY